MVGGAGSNQTPKVTTPKFIFNAANGNLTATGAVSGSTMYKANSAVVPAVFIKSAALSSSPGSPTPIQNGDLWYNTDTGKLNIWWSTAVAGSAGAWVEASPVPDMSNYYTTAGGNIYGNVGIQGALNTTGNILVQGTGYNSISGSLGVGIVNPSYKVDVVGDVNITGNYRINGTIVSVSGYSGYSGAKGSTGSTGASGYSGYSGTNGSNGATGASGYSGYSGTNGSNGATGTSGYSGYQGAKGSTGSTGASGYSGYSGTNGSNGATGTSGYSGYQGAKGSTGSPGGTGTSGYSGYSGTNGSNGSPGSAGISGYSGYSGTNGSNGGAGTSGYSGFSGASNAPETYVTANPSSNVITIDLSTGTVFNSSLTANVNSFTISNPTAGKANNFAIIMTQDSTGGRTVTWTFTSKTLKWPGGIPPLVSSAANAIDIYSFVSNDGGSTWYGFAGGQLFS
jgi:hypothetical protein